MPQPPEPWQGSAAMPEIRHRASARARRLTLRVSPEGRVSCTRPRGVALTEARRFAEAQGGWIAARLAALPPRVVVAPGGSLPVEGQALALREGDVAAVRREGAHLAVPRGADRPGAAVAAWLRDLARDRLAAACARHAEALGRAHGRIRLGDPRSRWGSCSPRGDLMFSWRLAMAPPEVLSYVAAHEVAHLSRMDHSAGVLGGGRGAGPGLETPARLAAARGRGADALRVRGCRRGGLTAARSRRASRGRVPEKDARERVRRTLAVCPGEGERRASRGRPCGRAPGGGGIAARWGSASLGGGWPLRGEAPVRHPALAGRASAPCPAPAPYERHHAVARSDVQLARVEVGRGPAVPDDPLRQPAAEAVAVHAPDPARPLRVAAPDREGVARTDAQRRVVGRPPGRPDADHAWIAPSPQASAASRIASE